MRQHCGGEEGSEQDQAAPRGCSLMSEILKTRLEHGPWAMCGGPDGEGGLAFQGCLPASAALIL